MARRHLIQFLNTRTPGITGAVFCAVLALAFTACDKKSGTPEWDTPGGSTPSSTTPAVAQPEEESTGTEASGNARQEERRREAKRPAERLEASSEALRFVAYNVENWLTMDRYVNRKSLKGAGKPKNEKHEVVRLLLESSPDVVGICEVGKATDLSEIQDMLKTAGLDLPHMHYTGGSDPVRHLGILSRFPILSKAKPAESDFQLQGNSYSINRGILDVTIRARGKSYRFLGVHLKSKREVDYADQEQIRIHEARLLRRHVDSILEEDPEARLVVYGDFNDTRPSKTFKTVTGSYNSPGYLTAIPFEDSKGYSWTHYWEYHDIYSRIDFVAVSKALKPEVDFSGSFIIDDPEWNAASDHRAILAIFD